MTATTIKKEMKATILGSGLSGMLTALAFAQAGIKTTIVEAQSVKSSEFLSDSRTTALTPCSREFLNNLQLWEAVENISSTILNIYVADNKAPEMLHFYLRESNQPNSNLDINLNDLGYVVENAALRHLLLSAVQQNNLITIIDNCTYHQIESLDDSNIIHLSSKQTINCDLLAVCDGYKSQARNYYFNNKIEKYYQQTAITFNVEHEKDHEGTAVEHFMPPGPFAILPLRQPQHSSVIWTVENQQSKLLMSLPLKELEYLAQRNFGTFLGNVKITSKISSFPLKARLTDKYFHNHVVLTADTAHIIHPLAGQGFNQGIKDIKTLVELIKNNGINKLTLQEYQRLREKDNMAMYLITDNLNKIFSNDSKLLHGFRRIGLSAINRSYFLKKQLIKYAGGKR